MLSVNKLSFDRDRIYSIPFIHIGSSGAFLFFCLGKQSENKEAHNSEKRK